LGVGGSLVTVTPADLEAMGLGLQYGTVRLVPTRAAWRAAATGLIADLRAVLGPAAQDVRHIGSTAVDGILAKPIIDLAVLLAEGTEPDRVVGALGSIGYDFRGDAGDGGGLVFVLDVRPLVRVAHVHAIADGDGQWARYLAFVELLRADPAARAAYQQVKRELATAHPERREAYTKGKTAVVNHLVAPR
jgi:GrpB-like predicted nucleotidyltransferase (UPF0157 family)